MCFAASCAGSNPGNSQAVFLTRGLTADEVSTRGRARCMDMMPLLFASRLTVCCGE